VRDDVAGRINPDQSIVPIERRVDPVADRARVEQIIGVGIRRLAFIIRARVDLRLRPVDGVAARQENRRDWIQRAPVDQLLDPEGDPWEPGARPVPDLKRADRLLAFADVEKQADDAAKPPGAAIDEILRDEGVPVRYVFGPRLGFTRFIGDILGTPQGWKLIGFGTAIGSVFAVVVLSIGVISFPLLLDRDVGLTVAVLTSLRAVRDNPVTMAIWGLIVAAVLAIGFLALFVGLAVAVPILAHASWHLYRKVVEPATPV
jgi:hypothetical protein